MITWISWEKHRRTKELCAYLGIENKVFTSAHSRWLRHPVAIAQTVSYLFQNRPSTLIVQCPSIFLALIGVLLKPLLGYSLIVDAHNAALKPESTILQRFYFLYQWVHRSADVVVVTNDNLVKIVEGNGGRAFVLPDRLFDPPVLEPIPLQGKHNIAFVCSFDIDEPYTEVFEAFKSFPETTLYVTGRAPTDIIETYKKYTNIVFTGFTPLRDYLTLLRSVDGILALTTREDSMLCAANEAVSFAKPMIISNSEFLKSYFAKGAIYTANTTAAITEAYQTFISNYNTLQAEIDLLKPQLSLAWQQRGEQFKLLAHSSPSEIKNYYISLAHGLSANSKTAA